jgi:malonyl-CoA decarboxylase
VLTPLCAWYLLRAKKGSEPRDSVARFHLRNGSQLDRINWLADTSPLGLKSSFGLMVNYVYRLSNIEHNHERYTQKYKVAASGAIEALAAKADPGRELVTSSATRSDGAKDADGSKASSSSASATTKPSAAVIHPIAGD